MTHHPFYTSKLILSYILMEQILFFSIFWIAPIDFTLIDSNPRLSLQMFPLWRRKALRPHSCINTLLELVGQPESFHIF